MREVINSLNATIKAEKSQFHLQNVPIISTLQQEEELERRKKTTSLLVKLLQESIDEYESIIAQYQGNTRPSPKSKQSS